MQGDPRVDAVATAVSRVRPGGVVVGSRGPVVGGDVVGGAAAAEVGGGGLAAVVPRGEDRADASVVGALKMSNEATQHGRSKDNSRKRFQRRAEEIHASAVHVNREDVAVAGVVLVHRGDGAGPDEVEALGGGPLLDGGRADLHAVEVDGRLVVLREKPNGRS